jgi:sirohydrochlorin cobaltochelatase
MMDRAVRAPVPDETAIVLTAYGSIVPRALSTFRQIEDQYRLEFPGCEIRLTFSSDLMRRRLAEKEGILVPGPLKALAEVRDCGRRTVIMQSLQIVPGNDFHQLASLLRGLRQADERLSFQNLKLGLPLLSGIEDCRMVSKAVLSMIEEGERLDPESKSGPLPEQSIVLAGHGSGHPADGLYLTLSQVLGQSRRCVLAGTLEGYPGIDEVLRELAVFRRERVTIVPLFLVPGGHVMTDLAGDEPNSWKSRMRSLCQQVEVIRQGLGERDEICSIFLDHTRAAMKSIQNSRP